MRSLAIVVFVLGACVHQPPLTPQEQCATNGMIVSGVAMSLGNSTGVASGGGVTVVSHGTAYGQTVSCQRAYTVEEKCELHGARQSAVAKLDWDPFFRNALIGIGLVAFIVPGIVLSVVFHGQADDADDDATAAGQRAQTSCLSTGRQPQQGPPGLSQ